jgi:hypothetical protein
VFVVFY